MTNFQVYRKTLSFSLLMFAVDIAAVIVFVGCCVGGFFIANRSIDMALIGLAIGLVVGIILASLINIFVTNHIKAAQIAMMTKGVNDNELPDHTFKAGFEEIKGRFGKITVFFFITRAIRSIFRQIGRSINRIGTAVGGEVGNSVTSVIDSAIQTLIGYLCDCCLGWILFRKDINSARAGCEGAVIFFKHGKTLIRNIGRIFGMGILSFLLVGGAFFGIIFLILRAIPGTFFALMSEIAEAAARNGDTLPEFLSDSTIFMVFAAAVGAIILWSILHSILVRPFILVGVLRNFMAAGKERIPSEQDFAELDSKSPRFARLHNSF